MKTSLGFALAAALTVLAAACGAGSDTSAPPSDPVTISPGTTTSPTSAVPSTPTPTPVDSPTVPIVSATPTDDPGTPGPPATYLGDGTSEVAGVLRTFCWQGTCADAFELPPKRDLTPLVIDDPADGLRFRAVAPFNGWEASYSPRAMEDLEPLARGGALYDPDISASVPATFTEVKMTAPPPGEWIVYIVMNSLENEAHYAWRVEVR